MKKFWIKGAAALLLIVANSLLLNLLYKNTNHWKDENNVKKFFSVPYDVQLGNVGSSHGVWSFNYAVITDYCCANLGLSAQRHDMSYLVLKQYINHMTENAVLLIPISYLEINCISSNFEEMQAGYYRILSPELIPDFSFPKKISFDILPIFSTGRNIAKIFNDEQEGYRFIHTYEIEKADEQELPSIAEKTYYAWTSQTVDKGEEGFIYNQQALAKIIDLCLEHNIKPVLITTPITDVLNEYFDNHDGFFDTFYRFIDTVQAKYPDIPYFDYSHDERFSPDHTLFRDSDHLNKWGAEKFTPIVVSDLEKAGLLVK